MKKVDIKIIGVGGNAMWISRKVDDYNHAIEVAIAESFADLADIAIIELTDPDLEK